MGLVAVEKRSQNHGQDIQLVCLDKTHFFNRIMVIIKGAYPEAVHLCFETDTTTPEGIKLD